MITIYHNNRCGKSRTALSILQENLSADRQGNLDFKVVEYLKDVPTIEEITAIIKKLKIKPHDLIRTKEAIYIEKYKGKTLTDAQWIQAIHDNPILMERPIVINGNKAVVARPSEKVLEIL